MYVFIFYILLYKHRKKERYKERKTQRKKENSVAFLTHPDQGSNAQLGVPGPGIEPPTFCCMG